MSEFEPNDVPEVELESVPEVELDDDLGEEEEVIEDDVVDVVDEDDAE